MHMERLYKKYIQFTCQKIALYKDSIPTNNTMDEEWNNVENMLIDQATFVTLEQQKL